MQACDNVEPFKLSLAQRPGWLAGVQLRNESAYEIRSRINGGIGLGVICWAMMPMTWSKHTRGSRKLA